MESSSFIFHAAPPEICRIQGGNTKTIWGVGFEPGKTEVYAWDVPFDREQVIAGLLSMPYPRWKFLPAKPPKDASRLNILDIDSRGLVMAVEFDTRYDAGGFYDVRAGGQVVWVRNSYGFSRPWLVQSPQLWWIYPERAHPGQEVHIFGRNLDLGPDIRMSRMVALKPLNGGQPIIIGSFSDVRHPVYEISMNLPDTLEPGDYEVYVHNGTGGKAGWGGPVKLKVELEAKPAKDLIDARELGVRGNGIDDDTIALRHALARASESCGGVVFLPPGRFVISETLELPEGVSLQGAGPQATIIEVLESNPMRCDFPDAVRLEGYACDWLPHMRGFGYAPMLWLRNRSGVSNLTLRSGPGVGMGILVARCPGVAENIVIERTRLEVGNPTLNWISSVPVLLAGYTYGLIIRDNEFLGHGGIDTIANFHKQAYIGRNVIRCIPHGRHNNIFLRGFVESVIEDNVVSDGQRNFVSQLGPKIGKHEQPEGKQAPSTSSYHIILRGNIFNNNIPRRHNEGENMYEAGGAFWHGRPVSVNANSITVEGEPFWTDMSNTFVLILDGRGLGQYRRVVENTSNTLTLDPPWDIIPDSSSYLMVGGFFVETLWIDNTEEHTANWTGFWGNNVGHVIDGHIQRDGLGLYLWAWDRNNPSPVAFCDIIGSRMINRGNITMLGPLVFGNTVRFSEVVGFRYRPGFHIQPTWLQGMDPSFRTGIDLEAAPHQIEGLPEPALIKDWNIIEGNHIYDGPRGIYVSREARHTIIKNNAIYVDGEEIVDASGNAMILGERSL